MLVGNSSALIQQVLSAMRDDYLLACLHVMGADAWSLASHSTRMCQTPGFELNDSTDDPTAT